MGFGKPVVCELAPTSSQLREMAIQKLRFFNSYRLARASVKTARQLAGTREYYLGARAISRIWFKYPT